MSHVHKQRAHVVLVPGFFGFTRLGDLEYFHGVRQRLTDHLGALGIRAELHQVDTPPTASIRHRAARILDTLFEIARTDTAPIHLVGHSTGGLDMRLAIAPTADLPTENKFEAYERVRTLVTVATPHCGTPLAEYAGGPLGKHLLRLVALSIVFALRRGELPLRGLFKLGYLWNRLDDYVGLRGTVADRLYANLLQDFSSERRREVVELIYQVSSDQALLLQLTAAGCDLLNAGTGDPDAVRYGCVVTRARPFGLGGFLVHRHDPYAHALHLVFGATNLLLSRAPGRYQASISETQARQLEHHLGAPLSGSDNDGIVPSLSQVWGDVIHAAHGDHLDVVGHFNAREQARADFIASASGFDGSQFDAVWRDVAHFIGEDRLLA